VGLLIPHSHQFLGKTIKPKVTIIQGMESVPERENEAAPQKATSEEPRVEEHGARMSESNLMEESSGKSTSEAASDEEGPKSSAENIIPLDKLANGWNVVSGFMVSAANKVSTTASDAYNSEQVAAAKRRTSEVVAPAWQKTCEVAAPIWATTVSTAAYAAEKTKEGAVYAKDVVRNCIDRNRG
jgi:hypothetical protein